MAEWFRSAEMKYVSLIVNEDAAHSCVNDLGLLGVIQFTDVSHESVMISSGSGDRA
jgi:V-type H+-transporting ATPase subunit a